MNGKQAKRARKVAHFHPQDSRAPMEEYRHVKKFFMKLRTGERTPVILDRITLRHAPMKTPRWRYQQAKQFFQSHNHIEKGVLTRGFRP